MAEIPTEALEAAARAAEQAWMKWEPPAKTQWQTTSAERYRLYIAQWCAAIEAAAPYLIAEGRRQAAREIVAFGRDQRDLGAEEAAYRRAQEIAEGTHEQMPARYERELRARIAGEIEAEAGRIHGLGGDYNEAVAVGLTAAARMLREELDPAEWAEITRAGSSTQREV